MKAIPFFLLFLIGFLVLGCDEGAKEEQDTADTKEEQDTADTKEELDTGYDWGPTLIEDVSPAEEPPNGGECLYEREVVYCGPTAGYCPYFKECCCASGDVIEGFGEIKDAVYSTKAVGEGPWMHTRVLISNYEGLCENIYPGCELKVDYLEPLGELVGEAFVVFDFYYQGELQGEFTRGAFSPSLEPTKKIYEASAQLSEYAEMFSLPELLEPSILEAVLYMDLSPDDSRGMYRVKATSCDLSLIMDEECGVPLEL